MKFNRRILLRIYKLLYAEFGPQHWWPGETKIEIILGAILTQNTAWKNVEKAIINLKGKNMLDINQLLAVSETKLAKLIKPSGYYNVKANRIKHFLHFLADNYDTSLEKMFSHDTPKLRNELLKVKGIGQETADSILLYAGRKPVFVIDAYTKRVLKRHNIINDTAKYEDMQALFTENLPKDIKLYNEYHALIVQLGKSICRAKVAMCEKCPIRRLKNA